MDRFLEIPDPRARATWDDLGSVNGCDTNPGSPFHSCWQAKSRQLTVQGSRHKLARDVCHGKRGTIHQAYRDGMEDQLGALGLVLNAIVLWTSRYIDAAVAQFRAEGHEIHDEDIARLSPLKHKNLSVLGRYSFNASTPAAGGLRPMRDPDAAGLDEDDEEQTGSESLLGRGIVPPGSCRRGPSCAPGADASSHVPLREWLQGVHQFLAVRGQPVANLHRRGGDDGALDEARRLQFLQAPGEQPVGDAGDHRPVLAETAGALDGGLEDRAGPAAPDQFEGALEARAGVVMNRIHLQKISTLPIISSSG